MGAKRKTVKHLAYRSCLSVEGLELFVKLGHSTAERKKPRKAVLDLRFYYPSHPAACRDDYDDSFTCYGTLCETIAKMCKGEEFLLMEYLVMRIYEHVRKKVSADVKIWVRLKKPDPPASCKMAFSGFTYSDLPVGAQVVDIA